MFKIPIAFPQATFVALIICIAFGLVAGVYASITPPFEGPDEGSHFYYIHDLIETHELPVLESRDVVFATESLQRHHPPLYYVLGALLVGWTDRSDIDSYFMWKNPFAAIGQVSPNNNNLLLHMFPQQPAQTGLASTLLRAYSVVLAMGTLWCVFLISRLVFSGTPIAILSMLLVASMPSFIFIGASINNDNLITLEYALGVYWVLRLWHRQLIRTIDALVVGLIFASTLLTKLNGTLLVVLMLAGIGLGAWQKYYPWRAAIRLGVIAGGLAFALAGWWYIRNWQLYGDPLALAVTQRIWGRGSAPSSLTAILDEAGGVWKSFWMVLASLNIGAPPWVYPYTIVLGLVGCVGAMVWVTHHNSHWPKLLLLVGAVVGVVVMLISGTTKINISQGRILFPALAGFAPLVMAGWWQVARRQAVLAVLPLTVLALVVPVSALRPAFYHETPIDNLPPDIQMVQLYANDLEVVGYKLLDPVIRQDGTVRLWVYTRGSHPANPALSIKTLDPISQTPLGGADVYPGMQPTATRSPEILYKSLVRLQISQPPELAAPCRLDLVFAWFLPGDPVTFLSMQNIEQQERVVLFPGPVHPQGLGRPMPLVWFEEAQFGDAIELTHLALDQQTLLPGDPLTVSLDWVNTRPIVEDWSLAIGLLDSTGRVVVQADGYPAGYPTSAWLPWRSFTDERTLMLPGDLAEGDYQLYVGWYSPVDGQRLPAYGANVKDNLFVSDWFVRVLPTESVNVVS